MQLSTRTFLVISVLLFPVWVHAEDEVIEESHATSVAGMVNLLMLEAELIESLESYANKLERKLEIVKSLLPQLRAESDLAMNQSEAYVSNPLKAFSLIRRMHKDWSDWKIFMEEPVGTIEISFINKMKSQLPTKKDLIEACEGIYRLQDVYHLRTTDMAKGLLNGKQYDASLNALDTYELGQLQHKTKQRVLAEEWFAETAKWLLEHTLPTPLGADHGKVLHLFGHAFLTLKYYSIALPIFDYAVRLENKVNDPKLLHQRAEIEKLALAAPKPGPSPVKEDPLHHKGCRGEFDQQFYGKCFYKKSGSPFLRLAPFKIEFVLYDPMMVIFHDVLSDAEMEELKESARPYLLRTAVVQKNKNVEDKERTSKGTWIHNDNEERTKRIARRIEDMTDLNLEYSDLLQIMNYGIGGHYRIHHDYFSADRAETLKGGNRIATVLFYLSDVEQGGATVFPLLGRAFSPVRGSALFWYNLHRNGEGDERTLHAGCPVLVGSKWIMTKWIYERSQLFTRPCL